MRKPNYTYFVVVGLLTFLIPFLGFFCEHWIGDKPLSFESFGKWFILSAVGIRLLLAGLRQTTRPGFTAEQIFHLYNTDSNPIIRELGFANICAGLVGIAAFFLPSWRPVSAFSSGIYYAFAGILHMARKPEGPNERLALWTDLIIFAVLAVYFVIYH